MRLNPEKRLFTLLLGIFSGLPAVSIDLSAPTLTILPGVLGTTTFIAGLTLSLFMVGFGVGQFFGGRLSDRYGRRPVLIVGLSIFTFAGLCCFIATGGEALLLARCLQGLGAGSCAVQAMAIVHDVCQADAARRRQANVTAITTIMPMLAPSLGALMVAYFGWRSVHLVLAGAGLLLLTVVVGFVGETRDRALRRLTAGLGVQAAGRLLRQPAFARLVATNACSYGAIFSYIAGTPVVMMGPLGYSNYEYAALFAGTALSLASGAYCSAPLGRIVSGDAYRMVGPALATQAACAVLLLLPNPHDKVLQLCFIVPALLLGCFARGVAAPTMVHLAISANRMNSGLAAAVLGLAQLLCGAVAGGLVAAMLPRHGYYAEIGMMATLSCLSISLWLVTKRLPQPLSEPA